MAGAHYAYLLKSIKDLADTLITAKQEVRRKNSGVVKPGLNAEPYREPVADDERKSAVIRPRVPKTDQDDTNAALESARNRVQ